MHCFQFKGKKLSDNTIITNTTNKVTIKKWKVKIVNRFQIIF